MSERKVLNKYYPPDFDPSKIPRMKLPKNRQYTVRLMAPFNMRCTTCGEYIYKGKKFNARKEDVENETYLGIRIYRFYIKCTRCLQEISFKTDPKNTDYEIEAGATRNFMALKLAEEQAIREEKEAREEEANNPMKLLENRTQQSRNEIEVLESLEELKDLNRRQQIVNYDEMLSQFNREETEAERLERIKREDEEFIKSVNFQHKTTKGIVAEEIIEEVSEEDFKEPPKKLKKTIEFDQQKGLGKSAKTLGLSNLVKTKNQLVRPIGGASRCPSVKLTSEKLGIQAGPAMEKLVSANSSSTKTDQKETSGSQASNDLNLNSVEKSSKSQNPSTTPSQTDVASTDKSKNHNALSMLTAYSDSSDGSE